VRAKLGFAALLFGVSGCNFWYNEVPSPDDLMHWVPWFDHMILSQAVHPYQRSDIPRNTPAGIVPVGGAEAEWGAGNPTGLPFPTYGFNIDYANTLSRPTQLAPADASRGAELYQVYCAVCHGPAGAGGGTIPGMPAPMLNTAQVAGYTDGYLYSVVRYGRGLMPRYGDKIPSIDDRWAVVDYVRSLAPGRQP
jgi:mono/diheme cytochrome c family protein